MPASFDDVGDTHKWVRRETAGGAGR
jgi:hypothetical protein